MRDENQLTNLKRETGNFYNLFVKNGEDYKTDWQTWDFKNGIPNQDKFGCYAFITESEIIYIGVGAGKNSGKYDGAGLGQRLNKYWKKVYDSADVKYKLNEEYFKDIESSNEINLVTLAIEPSEVNDKSSRCLAYALEVYLIEHLTVRLNKINNNLIFP